MNKLIIGSISVVVVLMMSACGEDTGSSSGAPAASDDCVEGEEFTTDSGLKYEDTTCGTGAEAETGSSVLVHYTGTLEDGTKFDSSRDRNQPYPFTIGAAEVIAGWDEGVVGMKVGGVRVLTIPPDLGYGETGFPPVIPPGATLIFELELVEVQTTV